MNEQTKAKSTIKQMNRRSFFKGVLTGIAAFGIPVAIAIAVTIYKEAQNG